MVEQAQEGRAVLGRLISVGKVEVVLAWAARHRLSLLPGEGATRRRRRGRRGGRPQVEHGDIGVGVGVGVGGAAGSPPLERRAEQRGDRAGEPAPVKRAALAATVSAQRLDERAASARRRGAVRLGRPRRRRQELRLPAPANIKPKKGTSTTGKRGNWLGSTRRRSSGRFHRRRRARSSGRGQGGRGGCGGDGRRGRGACGGDGRRGRKFVGNGRRGRGCGSVGRRGVGRPFVGLPQMAACWRGRSSGHRRKTSGDNIGALTPPNPAAQ